MNKRSKIDPDSLCKRGRPSNALHLNVRIVGSDADVFALLRERTAGLTDSQRVRDSVRLAVYIMARRESGAPMLADDGEDVLKRLGLFS